MFTSSTKTGYARRALMAAAFVATAALSIGAGTAPAHAQYYSYYGNPYYSQNYGYREGYPAHYGWWRWHQYWRWQHGWYR
jgi:hypothetical protein